MCAQNFIHRFRIPSVLLADMKAAREHWVPLSDRALAVLDEARELLRASNLVFPSQKGRMQGHHPMGKMMRKLETGAVPPEFRSSFRDWAAECTEALREVCGLALARVNGDRVEAAYAAAICSSAAERSCS